VPRKTSLHLIAILVALIGASALVLTWEALHEEQHAERSLEFQRLVTGLGFGPSLDLSRGDFQFDPRLADHESDDENPLPGGARYTGNQGQSIFFHRPKSRTEQMTPARD
jgi:hypothetical protein